MNKLKKFSIYLIISLLCANFYVFAGCNNSTDNSEENENSETYKIITTLNSSKISDYYASGTTIHITNQGAVTLILDSDSNGTGFSWNLSDCNFKATTEYAVKFTDLSISGFSETTPNNAALELYWADSTYQFLRYFNTKTHNFETTTNFPDNYLFLNTYTYDTYEIRFKFHYTDIINTTTKRLFFNFTGIELNGIVSFDSISIYEIN